MSGCVGFSPVTVDETPIKRRSKNNRKTSAERRRSKPSANTSLEHTTADTASPAAYVPGPSSGNSRKHAAIDQEAPASSTSPMGPFSRSSFHMRLKRKIQQVEEQARRRSENAGADVITDRDVNAEEIHSAGNKRKRRKQSSTESEQAMSDASVEETDQSTSSLQELVKSATNMESIRELILQGGEGSSHGAGGASRRLLRSNKAFDALCKFKDVSVISRHVRDMDCDTAMKLMCAIIFRRDQSSVEQPPPAGMHTGTPNRKDIKTEKAAKSRSIGRSIWSRLVSWKLSTQMILDQQPSHVNPNHHAPRTPICRTPQPCHSEIAQHADRTSGESDKEGAYCRGEVEGGTLTTQLRILQSIIKHRLLTNRKFQELQGKLSLLDECIVPSSLHERDESERMEKDVDDEDEEEETTTADDTCGDDEHDSRRECNLLK